MSKIKLCLFVFLLSFLSSFSIYAEEIKYDFSEGAVYSYEYSRQDISAVSAPIIATKKNSSSKKIAFDVKIVGFQDNAFIVDIGNENATFRRYISKNGSLKGAPAEDRGNFPFFFVFPEGDWRVGTPINQKTEVISFGKRIPINWVFTLNKIDSGKSLAEIGFSAKFDVSDDRFYSKGMTLNGQILFNLAEGVIHQADWKTNYVAKQICKEMSITRELWSFQKQTAHSLRMTGVEK